VDLQMSSDTGLKVLGEVLLTISIAVDNIGELSVISCIGHPVMEICLWLRLLFIEDQYLDLGSWSKRKSIDCWMSNSAGPWTHLFVCNSPNSIQTLSNILPYWTTAQILIQSYLVQSS